MFRRGRRDRHTYRDRGRQIETEREKRLVSKARKRDRKNYRERSEAVR